MKRVCNIEFPIEVILYQKDPSSDMKIIYVFNKDFDNDDAYSDFKYNLEQRCYYVCYYPYSGYSKKA